MYGSYEESLEEEAFYRQMQYEAALQKVRSIIYDRDGNMICPDCGNSMFVHSDVFGVQMDCETGLVKCCNCGTICEV